ncbi:MAG TPA: hypothetical protein VNA20_17125 [Frankiaceae bacterium]|nr:hypothetical protein [Frankiaceae bacterium]
METRSLSLRVVPGEDPDRPMASVHVDGVPLTEVWRLHLRCFDPDELFGDPVLLPADPPRRVAVLVCSCGEPGCEVVAPLVEREGPYVAWRGARRYCGVFEGPTADASEIAEAEPQDGVQQYDPPDLRFDAAAYEAEVRRAAADRSWETPRRATARLLRERLREEPVPGHTVLWVGPHQYVREGFRVSLLDAGGYQLVIDVLTPERPPREWAAAAEAVVRAGPGTWYVTYRGTAPLFG